MNIPLDITFASGANVLKNPFDPADNAALAAIVASPIGYTGYQVQLPTRPFWIMGENLEVSAAATLVELGVILNATWEAAIDSHVCLAAAGAGIVRVYDKTPGPFAPIDAAALGRRFRIRGSSAAGFRLTGMLDLWEQRA